MYKRIIFPAIRRSHSTLWMYFLSLPAVRSVPYPTPDFPVLWGHWITLMLWTIAGFSATYSIKARPWKAEWPISFHVKFEWTSETRLTKVEVLTMITVGEVTVSKLTVFIWDGCALVSPYELLKKYKSLTSLLRASDFVSLNQSRSSPGFRHQKF